MISWIGHRWWIVGSVLVVLLLRGATAGGAEPSSGDTVTIGSKSFTENRLLGEIMAQLVEARTDLHVDRMLNLGGTTVVFAAVRSGDIDLYPEYTGTGWTIHLGLTERVNDPLRAYLRVADAFERRFDITWLRPFGFGNSYALAMDETVADTLGIRRISDLQPHQSTLRAGVSHEFLSREDGYPGLARAYGLDIDDLRGMEHGLAYEAIRSGRIDLVDTWTTDGKLLRYDIRILEDDRGFFPPYDCAPVVRTSTLERHPELASVLAPLAFRIDDRKMRRLNFRVEEEGGAYEDVARDFLRDEGLLDGPRGMTPRPARPHGLAEFLWSRRSETLALVLQHLWLTAVAVGLAVLVAVPLGLLLTRRRWLAPPVLGVASVIQTVPSLALLAFMIPVPGLGLGARSAVAALFLYALLPILRNTHAGVGEVDPALIEAARGMGLRDREILLRVELPLATRTIMAGIRTSAVISIGVATLAAFIGAGGLGDPIVTGLQLNDIDLILSGAIPAAGLALAADVLLGLAQRVLVPRGIR